MLNDFGKYFMKKLSVEECQKLSIQYLYNTSVGSFAEVNGQFIELTKSKCNYGGDRVWFLCPACSRRVGTLYRRPLNHLFLCRNCNNLTYQLRKYHRSPHESYIKAIKSMKGSDLS